MNIKIIAYLLSKICIFMAAAMLVPAAVALYYGESCYKEFLMTIGVTAYLAFVFEQYSRGADRDDISLREGVGTVFFSWILVAFLASLPYIFLQVLDPVAAYFESMSGLTTTGSTCFRDLNVLPRGILFWRSMTHWIGGIGIIVLFIVFLPQISGGAVYLFNAEVSGFTNSRILPRIRATAIALFYIYLFMTIILTGLLVMEGMTKFDAVNHAFSAVATGGFSNYNDSVAHFNSVSIEVTLGIFMLLAAGNFALYYKMLSVGVSALWKDLEFKAYLLLVTVVTLLIAWNIAGINGMSYVEALRHSFFQTTSFASTTGYVSYDYEQWPSFAKLLLALMYFTGGCAGSTAGGIKICRFVVLLKTIAAEMRRTLHPQMLLVVHYNKRTLPGTVIINISRFFFIYILTVVVLALALAATGQPLEEALFGVAACLSSVGPAFGALGAAGNYADVSAAGKIILCLAMLLGRLEIFTALALLRSEYWRSSRNW